MVSCKPSFYIRPKRYTLLVSKMIFGREVFLFLASLHTSFCAIVMIESSQLGRWDCFPQLFVQ